MDCQRHAPAVLPPGKTPYPLCRRLGGPQSRPGQVRKISFPPGFDPQTVQPVVSRCTAYAIPAPISALVYTLVRINCLFWLLARLFFAPDRLWTDPLSNESYQMSNNSYNFCQLTETYWIFRFLTDQALWWFEEMWDRFTTVRRRFSTKRLHWPWPPSSLVSVTLAQEINRPACVADNCRIW